MRSVFLYLAFNLVNIFNVKLLNLVNMDLKRRSLVCSRLNAFSVVVNLYLAFNLVNICNVKFPNLVNINVK